MMRASRTRRAFLRDSALGAAAFARLSAAPVGIIDTHTHFYDPTRPGGVPWPPRTEALLYRRVLPEDFRKVTAGLGIEGTVVVEASPLVEDNQWILDLAKDDPAIVGFVGHLDPAAPDFLRHLARFARNPLFRGIRLGAAALANPACARGLAAVAEAGLTLDVLGPASIFPDVVRIARTLPKLKIVIDHLPFDIQPGLPREENVYAKVSGVRPDTPRAALDQVCDAFGFSRVLYGSNWPVSERVAPYAEILKIVTGYFAARGAVANYFHANSRAVYGWRPRA